MKLVKKLSRFAEEFRRDQIQRGFGIAVRKARESVWHHTHWSVWCYDFAHQSAIDPWDGAGVKIDVRHKLDNPLLDELVQAWPSEMARYRPGFLEETIRGRFASDTVCVIMRSKEQLIGGVWLTPLFDKLSAQLGIPLFGTRMISTLFVSEKFRGEGMGTLLLQAAKRAAFEQRFERLLSLIEARRTPSLKTHERCGFQKKGDLFEKKTFATEKVRWEPLA